MPFRVMAATAGVLRRAGCGSRVRSRSSMRCPNPDCPYARKHHRPAEYRAGIAACTDCGAALVDGAVDLPATSSAIGVGRASASASALPWPGHVVTALVLTALGAFAPLVLAFVPLPYIERDAML